jgi:hypothetical protein
VFIRGKLVLNWFGEKICRRTARATPSTAIPRYPYFSDGKT